MKFQIRLLTEKVSDPPESCQERTVQFSIPTWQVSHGPHKDFLFFKYFSFFITVTHWQVLNGLERLGYRVISCGSLLTGYTKFDTKDVIWTLHKTREDWEAASSK